MRTFIKKIVFYSGFIILIIVLLQLIISIRIEDKTTSDNNPTEMIQNCNADLVFLGSSRCSMHFSPHFFNTNYKIKSINLGINGHSDLAMALLQLKLYTLSNKPPKFAILNFDPFIYSGDTNNNTNFTLKDEFARYAFLPNSKDLLYTNYFKFNSCEKYIPLYALFKYSQLKNCLLIKNTNNYKKYGYQKHDGYWDTLVPSKIKNIKKNYFKRNQIKPIIKSLNQIKEFCNQNDIKLLCIQTPVHKSLYEIKRYSLQGKICKDLNIPFIDINNSYFNSNAKLYYNSNHLNTYGVSRMNLFLKNNVVFNDFISHQ